MGSVRWCILRPDSADSARWAAICAKDAAAHPFAAGSATVGPTMLVIAMLVLILWLAATLPRSHAQ